MKALKAKFFGSDILVINQNDKPYVPMKQVAENIGLVWHAQFERLQRNKYFHKVFVLYEYLQMVVSKKQFVCRYITLMAGCLV